MFDRYTEPARRVVFFAVHEARAFGSAWIDTHHLLLGLLRESRDLFTPFLKSDAEFEAIRKGLERRFPPKQQMGLSGDLPLTRKARLALKQAGRESERLKHPTIAPEHLILALLREKGGVAAEILEPYGMTYNDFRTSFGEPV